MKIEISYFDTGEVIAFPTLEAFFADNSDGMSKEEEQELRDGFELGLTCVAGGGALPLVKLKPYFEC